MTTQFFTETIMRATDRTAGVFRTMQRNATNASMAVRGLRKAGESIRGMGQTMSAGISAPMIAAGANSLRMATNFDDAMNETQSKLLITRGAMEPLRDMAKDLGSTTSFSASEAAKGMSFLAQAGYDTNKIMKTTPHTLNLAAAAGLDLAAAADIASNVMGAFELDKTKDIIKFEKNFQRVSDVLALTSAKSNTSVEELAEGMKQAAPWMNAFGIGVEETAASLGLMANIGIKGGEGGTAAKNMMANLVKPVGEGEKALNRLGIKQSQLFDTTKDGNKVFKGVVNMMQVMAKANLTNADAISVFGRETGHGIMGILDSEEAMEKLNKQLKMSGASAKMAAIRGQGLPGVINSMTSAWEGANLALAESGGFKSIIDGFQGATTALQKFAKANPETLASIAKWGIAAAVAGPLIMGLGATIASVGVIAKAAAIGFTALRASSLMLTAPVAAIAAAGYLIYKNWDGISAFAQGVWWGVKESLDGVGQAAKPLIDMFVSVKNTVSGWLFPNESFSEATDRINGLTVSGVQFGRELGKVLPLVATFAGGLLALKAGAMVAPVIMGGVRALRLLGVAGSFAAQGIYGLASRSLVALVAGAKAATLATLSLARRGFLVVAAAARTATIATLSFASRGLVALAAGAKAATLATLSLARRGFLVVAAAARTATIATLSFASRGLVALAAGAKAGAIATLGLISRGLRGVAVAARVAGAAMLVNPIGIALAAIAGAAYIVYKNWDSLMGLWNNSTLKEISMPLVTKALDYARDKWQQFTSWWDGSTLGEKAFGLVTSPFQLAKVAGEDLLNWWKGTEFGQKTMSVVASVKTKALDYARTKFEQLQAWWAAAPLSEKVFGIATAGLQAARVAGQDVFNWWANTPFGQKTMRVATGLLDAAKSKASEVFEMWKGTEFGQKTMSVLSGSIEKALEWGKKLADWWKNFNPVGKTLEVFGNAASSAKKLAGGAVDGLKSAGNSVLNFVGLGDGGVDGERAIGGTVTGGGIYRVNERGPELLNMAGNSYLMAAQSGTVTPLRDMNGAFRSSGQQAGNTVTNNAGDVSNNNHFQRMMAYSTQHAANSPVFNRNQALTAVSGDNAITHNNMQTLSGGYDAPLVGQSQQSGQVDVEMTVRIEADDGLRVRNSGAETSQQGSLIRNVGISMVAV